MPITNPTTNSESDKPESSSVSSIPIPSKLGLPATSRINPDFSDDTPSSWANRIVLGAPEFAEKLRSEAAAILSTEDLSDIGKRKQIATLAKKHSDAIHTRSLSIINDLVKEKQTIESRVKTGFDQLVTMDESRKAEIRTWLRSLEQKDRWSIIREATSGSMAGGTT